MDNCIFCKIANKELPSYKIYEDDKFYAFLDIHPIEHGHTLVIPKDHFETVWDISKVGEYFEKCCEIANHFKKITGKKYVYSFIHGEGVQHAHIHLIPSENDNFGKNFSIALNNINQLDTLSKEEGEKLTRKYQLN